MNITTTFSCGDLAWVLHNGRPTRLTIGQVRVEHTDSPGISQAGITFDNFAAQKSHTESYMCVDTGIGSGSVYTLGESIFATEQECIAANAERLAREKAEHERRRKLRIMDALSSEGYHRERLAEIEAMKLELAELQP